MNTYYWEKFYHDSVKPQIDNKGEAYVEWFIKKQDLIKQLNYLRAKYKLRVVWFEKTPDLFSIFIKPFDELQTTH